MAGYKTGAPELTKAAQDLDTANHELQQMLKSLQSRLEPLQGAWKGSASTAFHTLLERYSTDARQLNDRLEEISVAVRGSADTYVRQEEEQAQAMSQITASLG
jgi:WXG100 family type VII secretion target